MGHENLVSFSFLFHIFLYCPNSSLLEWFEQFYFPVRKKMYIYWWCLKIFPLLLIPTLATLLFHKLMPALLQACPKLPIITSMLRFILYISFFLKYHFTMLLPFTKSELYPLFSSSIPPIYAGLVHPLSPHAHFSIHLLQMLQFTVNVLLLLLSINSTGQAFRKLTVNQYAPYTGFMVRGTQ